MAGALPSPRTNMAKGMSATGGIGLSASTLSSQIARTVGESQKIQQVKKASDEPTANPDATRNRLAATFATAEPSAIISRSALADCVGDGISGAKRFRRVATSQPQRKVTMPIIPRNSLSGERSDRLEGRAIKRRSRSNDELSDRLNGRSRRH